MDTFVDSSWYYFRYLNPHFKDKIFDTSLTDQWVPVDMYVGGAEHATMHLLYARFIHKFLRDLDYTNSNEPFLNLIHQGTITNRPPKCVNLKGNVVNADEFTSESSSDVFRLYLMFMGPYGMGATGAIKGYPGQTVLFSVLMKLFGRFPGILEKTAAISSYNISLLADEEKIIYRKVNQTVKKFEEEIENFRFNTTIAFLMELLNELVKTLDKCSPEIQSYALENLVH